MLSKGGKALSEDRVHPEEEIKDPFVLEFLDLKDEYSEAELRVGRCASGHQWTKTGKAR
jgi:hypothetical protein